MDEKALRLLGLARKAGRVDVGEEPAGASCRNLKARLLLLASDAGEHTVRRARSYCRSGKPVCISPPFTKGQLGDALGYTACAICAITDPALALAFVQALGEPERYAAALDELTRQSARVTKRRQEEKAHRNNIKHGKK